MEIIEFVIICVLIAGVAFALSALISYLERRKARKIARRNQTRMAILVHRLNALERQAKRFEKLKLKHERRLKPRKY